MGVENRMEHTRKNYLGVLVYYRRHGVNGNNPVDITMYFVRFPRFHLFYSGLVLMLLWHKKTYTWYHILLFEALILSPTLWQIDWCVYLKSTSDYLDQWLPGFYWLMCALLCLVLSPKLKLLWNICNHSLDHLPNRIWPSGGSYWDDCTGALSSIWVILTNLKNGFPLMKSASVFITWINLNPSIEK